MRIFHARTFLPVGKSLSEREMEYTIRGKFAFFRRRAAAHSSCHPQILCLCSFGCGCCAPPISSTAVYFHKGNQGKNAQWRKRAYCVLWCKFLKQMAWRFCSESYTELIKMSLIFFWLRRLRQSLVCLCPSEVRKAHHNIFFFMFILGTYIYLYFSYLIPFICFTVTLLSRCEVGSFDVMNVEDWCVWKRSVREERCNFPLLFRLKCMT